MPTAAKLVAAVALAYFAYAVSQVVLYRQEALQSVGISHFLFVVVGFLVGWLRLGDRAAVGYRGGWSGGISASVLCFFWVIVLAAVFRAKYGMSKHRFADVDELVTSFFGYIAEYAQYILDGPTAVATVFAGLLAGTFASMAGRLWS